MSIFQIHGKVNLRNFDRPNYLERNLRLTSLTDRIRKLEPRKRGRVILVDGLKGQEYKEKIPKDFDPTADIAVLIGDVGDYDGGAS